MGEHKFNPTAQKAKEGLLPKKPEKISKCEEERRINMFIRQYLTAKTGLPGNLFNGPY